MVGYAATIPFFVLLALALWARRPLWQSGAAAFVLASILWISADAVGAGDLGGPCFKAFIVSCEVGLILLGAIAFLEYMHLIGATNRIQNALSRFTTDDPAMESLLLAWLFCGFLEGAAGFGAPAA